MVEEGIEPSRPLRVPASIEPGALNLSATPPGLVRVVGWITHGIHGDRERRLGPLIDEETRLFRLRREASPDRQTPRFGVETQDSVSPTAIAMQLAERPECRCASFLNL